ncbi:hypothetical protein DFQ01_107169 [Paenibacillus cellulosilyticus]|uniref:Uncharacterized protein n=2 Tax=Paenibacillus cellulosilyticus TaxID=375489 RepID=A0A2V2YUA0_9BACL|nr:hypothetical protein DFQ01_107169 [Paenibacillus cellulosilyticus]
MKEKVSEVLEIDKDQPFREIILKTYDRYNGFYGYRQVQLFVLQKGVDESQESAAIYAGDGLGLHSTP